MKKNKILLTIVFLLIMLFACTNVVFADNVGGMSVTITQNNTLVKSGNNIIGIAQIIGTGIAFVMLIVLGISYVVASPGDKAEIKKHAIVYVVGAIFIFATTNIVSIAYQIASNVK